MNILQLLIIIISMFSISVVASEADRAIKIIEDRCQLCHGLKGESSNVIYPRLAAQDKAYIIKQLNNFKSGTRKGTMNEMAADLTEENIIALAGYFSQQQASSHKVRDSDLNHVGRYIFLKGNKYSGVAACASCHGKDGSGNLNLPRLAGQHKRYISSQLEEFYLRKRTNDNSIMHSIASKLTELEREAVSLYVSGI